MLTSFDMRWDKLQEPARPAENPADYLLLLSALDEGWDVVEIVRLVDFERGQSETYLLTLFHPRRLVLHQVGVRRTAQVDRLLKNEAVTVINRHGLVVD